MTDPQDLLRNDIRFGSAPLNGIVFTTSEIAKEWDELPEDVKISARKHIHAFTQHMTMSNSIELLCHVINDLEKRIESLERQIKE